MTQGFVIKEAIEDAQQLLKDIQPFIDSVVCYASTISEHPPNTIPATLEEVLDRLNKARAQIDRLYDMAGVYRQCLTCGKYEDSTKVPFRGEGCEPDLEYGTLCMFDMTPREAVDYWRKKYHDAINNT